MTMNKTVTNELGRELKQLRYDFNFHVQNMIDVIEEGQQTDLSSFDLKVSFGNRQYSLGLNSNLSEGFTEMIDSQIEEYGTDITPMTNEEIILMLTDFIMTTNGDLPLNTPVSDEHTLEDVKELMDSVHR